jgi:hypothetical protein
MSLVPSIVLLALERTLMNHNDLMGRDLPMAINFGILIIP